MTNPRPASCLLLRQATALGLPFGQEISFKLLPGQLLDDRLLLGWSSQVFAPLHFIDWLRSMGLPPPGAALLRTRAERANAVLLSVEARGTELLYKAYFEFWDEVRATHRLRAPDTQAQPPLLHFGVKWLCGDAERIAQAEYRVHPLLSARDILQRLQDLPQGRSGSLGTVRAIVQRGAMRSPGAAMLYLEAREAGNARHSCDINLYKTGLQLHDAADLLRQLATSLAISTADFEPLLQAHQGLPLGHVAAGIDRHAQEFLSVYLGVHALPA